MNLDPRPGVGPARVIEAVCLRCSLPPHPRRYHHQPRSRVAPTERRFRTALPKLLFANAQRLWTVSDEILRVDNHDRCRNGIHIVAALRLQPADERPIDVASGRALTYRPRGGGRV